MDRYAETVAYLAGLEVARGWELGLERVRAALALRGHPERRFAAIHVAGTNGKGSTAAMIEACLRAAGRRTGLYTSPHLVDFAERIRARGGAIPHETVVALVDEVRRATAAAGIALTHFEFVTVVAFEWFAQIGVELAVVEVGLGGRLDATNVLAPALAVITPIALDHEAFLGTDLAAIAGEKAGIVKAGVPVCTGRLAPAAAAVVAERARAVGAPLWRAGHDGVLTAREDGLAFRGLGRRWDGLRLALRGGFQEENAELALLALAALGERWPCTAAAVHRGLATVDWPGRLAVVGEAPRVVVDGAHNPAAVERLAAELPAVLEDRPTTLVFAAMADKAWEAELERLLPAVRRVLVTAVGRRAASPAALAAAVGGRRPVTMVDDPRAAVREAVATTPPSGAVLVTGSLFLVGEAYAELGGMTLRTWQSWEGDGTEPRR